ncbi:MAG: hypothetical protein ACTHQ3_15785 [Motilibacteraceae bacterium]
MSRKRTESSTDGGFTPIEVEVGEQNAPIVSEVDFTTQQPQPAAEIKED